MRVLTRLTATLLTAGALIAPATMPAANAVAPSAVVVHTAANTFTPNGTVVPQPLVSGQPLVIVNNWQGAALHPQAVGHQRRPMVRAATRRPVAGPPPGCRRGPRARR